MNNSYTLSLILLSFLLSTTQSEGVTTNDIYKFLPLFTESDLGRQCGGAVAGGVA